MCVDMKPVCSTIRFRNKFVDNIVDGFLEIAGFPFAPQQAPKAGSFDSSAKNAPCHVLVKVQTVCDTHPETTQHDGTQPMCKYGR